MKPLLAFIRKWSDLLVILPITLLLFIFGDKFIHLIDPTAQILSVESLSILSFNLLCLFTIFTSSYFIWALYFGDLFKEGWEKLMENRALAYLISGGLWVSTLIISTWVLLRNL